MLPRSIPGLLLLLLAAPWRDAAADPPAVAAVFVAKTTVRARRDGQNELCAASVRRVRGESPAPRCTKMTDIVGRAAFGFGYTPGAPSWIAVDHGGGILAAQRCGDPGCSGAAPEAQLADQLRCGAAEQLWRTLPAEALACQRDDACALIESTCFAVAIAASHLATYRDAPTPCIAPNAGACPPFRGEVRCVNRHCQLDRR